MRYYLLKSKIRDEKDRARVVQNLLALRAQLDETVPDKDADQNLLLATWNIRDFGKINRRGYGPRLPETHFYIAEILSRFDFVAVQEINELEEWEIVMDILGPDYSYIATDVTDVKLGGNGERLTYLYDRRKVRFQNIAGEIVLPADMLISKTELEVMGSKVVAGKQFNRSPSSSRAGSNSISARCTSITGLTRAPSCSSGSKKSRKSPGTWASGRMRPSNGGRL